MKQGDIILILQKKNSSVIVKKWGLAPFIVIALLLSLRAERGNLIERNLFHQTN